MTGCTISSKTNMDGTSDSMVSRVHSIKKRSMFLPPSTNTDYKSLTPFLRATNNSVKQTGKSSGHVVSGGDYIRFKSQIGMKR